MSVDIFFSDPNEIPLAPEDVRILSLEAKPWPDRQRVEVRFELTPFEKRPNIKLTIMDANKVEKADLSVIETLDKSMDFTMHLRGETLGGSYTVEMQVFYTDIDNLADEEPSGDSAGRLLRKAAMIVDTMKTKFDIRPMSD